MKWALAVALSACVAAAAEATPQQSGVRSEEVVPREMSDAVAAHLESLGLDDLLATHLELQLDIALTDEERFHLVARLSHLLSARLERETDAAKRDALLARSTRIVDRFDSGSETLRLELLRAQHRAAQRVAEDRRAGRAGTEAAAAAAAQFKALTRLFDALAKRADASRQRLENDVSRAAGLRAEQLGEASNQQEQVSRSSRFFQAWALYYQAWLQRELGQDGWREAAAGGMTAFARLIEPGKAAVEPSEVSMDLRSNEGFASAVLGSALSASLVQSGPTADSWLALLEAPSTHESVRAKLPAWRMASLLDRLEFARALELLRAEGDGPQGAPMALIAAARAAHSPEAPGSAELLTEAVARIASAGRLADLAAMTAVEQAARNGAGAGLFEGVQLAARAQRAQQAGDVPGARALWGEAAKALESALGDGAPPAIVSGARALQGWALRGAGRAQEAAEAFVASARSSSGDRAGDAMWNAVLSLDEAARQGDRAASARADRIVEQVIRDYPGTAASVRAHAWRVVRADLPGTEDIDALLSSRVPPDLAPAARKAACEGLYRRFRQMQGGDRSLAARRALSVGDTDTASAGEDGTTFLRKRLEMALAMDDRSRAAETLAALEARTERSTALARQLEGELGARRAQLAGLDGRAGDSVQAARALDPRSPWGRVAWRAARDAVLRDPGATAAQRAAASRAVVLGDDPSRARTEDVVRWAQAEAALQRSGGATADGDGTGALAALASARAAQPESVELAMAESELRAARGDAAGAEEIVRTLLGRLAVGSDEWLQAKVLQVQAVAGTNPAKARALLNQVRQLAGGLGHGAAGTALQQLDRTLPKESK